MIKNEVICILTYDHPHRKTQDLLFRLKSKGLKNLLVVATPWQEHKSFKSLWPYRPRTSLKLPLNILCQNLDIRYELCNDYLQVHELFREIIPRQILIGGAGILPEKLVKRWKIINAHPGLLPSIRGLDAFKWAIWEEAEVGITTYHIGIDIDTGALIRRQETPLYLNDTIYSFAQRHYELEVEMLADSMDDYTYSTPSSVALGTTCVDDGIVCASPVHRRIPRDKELLLAGIFEQRVLENRFKEE